MKPPLACINCRARKKKCNRAYPTCDFCLRTHSKCSYRSALSSSGNSPKSVVLARLELEGQDAANRSGLWINASFLDHDLYVMHASTAYEPLPVRHVNPELRENIPPPQEIQNWLTTYFNFIDPWISFISERSTRQRLLEHADTFDGYDLILLASIRIMVLPLDDDEARSKTYMAIKSSFVNVEVHGMLSTCLLQAQLLVLYYEIGHGLYPAAYITLGTCMRYLSALGIDAVAQAPIYASSWIEGETRRRLWWAVFTMERSMALGAPQRTMLMVEPPGSTMIPCDDQSWIQESPTEHAYLTLASPPTFNMGNFRLLVHASQLVSRTIAHLAGPSMGLPLDHDTTVQLVRTMNALLNVLHIEDQSPITTVSVSRSILCSALFLLHDAVTKVGWDDIDILADARNGAASVFLERAVIFLQGDDMMVEKASPFLINWAYHTYRFYRERHRHEGHQETRHALDILENTFNLMAQKWKVTAVYMDLLNVSQ